MVALITGSTSDIGKSIALTLAENGYDIILHYHNDEVGVLNLASDIRNKYKRTVRMYKADLTKEEEINSLVEGIKKDYFSLDVLVNNAALTNDTDLMLKEKKEFLDVLDVNLVAPFLLAKALSSLLKDANGTIINISSNNALSEYYPESIDYDASKKALISLTNNLALYLAPEVRVNCVCPGWVNTKINKTLTSEFKKQEESKIFLRRFAEPIEVANVVAFLASQKASYINNTIIKVDGGVK